MDLEPRPEQSDRIQSGENQPWATLERSGQQSHVPSVGGGAGLQCPDMTSVLLPGSAPVLPLGVDAQHLLDAFECVTAIVDSGGVIVAVNRPWLDFMHENGGSPASCGVGANYLLVCDQASRNQDSHDRAGHDSASHEQPGCGLAADHEAPQMALGLRAGLAGTAGPFELEYTCHSPTRQHWYRLNVRPFETPGGRYALIQHSEITAHRVAQARAAELNSRALDALSAHTHVLRTENEELDAFIGAVSHDLRTPVRHLQGFLAMLRRKVGGDRWNADELRLLDILDGASERLQQMIDELLKLARVSKRELHFQDIDLTLVVQAAWANLTPEHQGRDLEWLLGALPVVRGDPALLRLAFENLLGNALKYSAGRGRASIRVRATAAVAGQGWVVSVQDDGVGFDPARAPRLFGAFQRLHSDREFAGVGMGLANVRRVVVRHGGQVWAESQVGQGATFFIRFPASQDAAIGTAAAQTQELPLT